MRGSSLRDHACETRWYASICQGEWKAGQSIIPHHCGDIIQTGPEEENVASVSFFVLYTREGDCVQKTLKDHARKEKDLNKRIDHERSWLVYRG